MGSGEHLPGQPLGDDRPTAPLRRLTPESSRPGPARPESARPEPARPEPARPEPARPGAVRPDIPWPAPPPGPTPAGLPPRSVPLPGAAAPSSRIAPAPLPAPPGRHGLRGWLEVHGALLLVLLIALGGMVQVLTEHWRQGSALLGGSLLVAGLLRGVLPPPRAGLLAIRGRVVDVICYTGFGIAVLLLALTITRGSLTVG